MANIYLTGMTASQASANANNRSLSFSGVLYKVLISAGHNVTWGDPQVAYTAEDLDKYDSVIVGIAPLTSLASNRVYGALSIIDQMWSSPKLTLLIDAPTVDQIDVSLRAIWSSPKALVKDFYSYRKDYAKIASSKQIQARLLDCIDRLLNQTWPKTIYPALPWKDIADIYKNLPGGSVQSLHDVSLDSYLLVDPDETAKAEKWVIESTDAKWSESVTRTVTRPVSPMKVNKGWTDEQVADQIARSVGVIISPHKKQGTWWSYRYIQALNAGTPVATEWKESGRIGDSWSVLAAGIDSGSEEYRNLIATAQREAYLANIPDKLEAMAKLKKVLAI